MNLYAIQESNTNVDGVAITRDGNSILFSITTTSTPDGQPRVDEYTLDYAAISARWDFGDRTLWSVGYNSVGPEFKLYNVYKETFPTKGNGATLIANRDSVNTVIGLLVPFKASSLSDCSILVSCEDVTKITADESFSEPVVVQNRAEVRPLVFPSVRCISTTPVGQDLDFVLQLTKNGQDSASSARIYLTCDVGSLSSPTVDTDANGQATVRIYGDPLRPGTSGVLNAGFIYWSGVLYVDYTTP